MTKYDVKRLGLILAVQADIEGMKASNKQAEMDNRDLPYIAFHFTEMAEKLREIVCRNDGRL